jgi:hypothetical protein
VSSLPGATPQGIRHFRQSSEAAFGRSAINSANILQCDRQWPCGACRRRNLKCEGPLSQEANITLVAYCPPASHQPIGHVLKDDSWLYIRIFFEAVSSSDIMALSALCFEEIGGFIQEQGPVFDAVAAVGAIYGHQTNIELRLSQEKIIVLRKFCATFRQCIRTRIQKPYALHDTSLLICIQLLAVLEVC